MKTGESRPTLRFDQPVSSLLPLRKVRVPIGRSVTRSYALEESVTLSMVAFCVLQLRKNVARSGSISMGVTDLAKNDYT